MPLGASRLTSISLAAAEAGFSGSTDASYTLTNCDYTNHTYQTQRLGYVGDNSSGEPVWFIASKAAGGDWEAHLIRRNNDDTISESATLTLKNDDTRFTGCSAVGEDTSGNDVGVFVGMYQDPANKIDTVATQIDKENLTLGTPYSLEGWNDVSPTAGFGYVAYGGNGRFVAGYRNGGIRTRVMKVTSSAITEEGSFDDAHLVGDGVYQDINGFPYSSGYRYGYYNGNDSRAGIGIWDNDTTHGGESDADNLLSGTSIAVGSVVPIATDEGIAIAGKSGYLEAWGMYGINWSTPSFSSTSTLELTDDTSNASDPVAAGDTVDNKAHILYYDGNWTYTSVSRSGSSLVEQTPEHISATTTNWRAYGHSQGAYCNSAQGKLAAWIIHRSSGAPQIYIKDVS